MDLEPIANRLVNELMLVSVLVAGDGAPPFDAAAFANALAEAGAAAEALAASEAESGFDLAILLVQADPEGAPGMQELAATLTRASERLLFVPLAPPSDETHQEAAPSLPELTRWFEIFAELGYQPVVDFDAGFVAPGAFLVDRGATAAESELAAFADRLQAAPQPLPRDAEPAPAPDAALKAEIAELREQLAAQEAHIQALAAEAARAETELHEGALSNAGWDGLRAWVNACVRDPARDTIEALLRDLPRLAALRGPEAPPLDVPLAPKQRRRVLSGLFMRKRASAASASPPALAETACVRASPFFDPAWYIASSADLSGGDTIDPVFHYVFVGALHGADPGPWFDTAAYLAAHADAASSPYCPLAHAVLSGAQEVSDAPREGA